jgi:hypothetical protein
MNTLRRRALRCFLVASILAAATLASAGAQAQSQDRGREHSRVVDRGRAGDHGSGGDRIRGGDRARQQLYDTRYHHDRYYPPRGYAVNRLDRGYRVVPYGRDRYYFRGGVWYRPYGPRFVVFAPPFGLVVPFLPDFYTTVWFGGVPYYYANEVYYRSRPHSDDYEIVEPPQRDDADSSAPATDEEVFIYPRHGQNSEQQSKDRYECHRWAVSQTGFDPSEPGGGVEPAANNAKRSDYHRAITACLEARDYSVK